uniref:Uncharacterized protein n=1 Tax=Elaeophora elaphi TaxID=1147741 RepID=A0A0R3RPZ3_9BILA
MDSDSRIHQSSSNLTLRTARSLTGFRPAYSPPVYPITPQRSPRQKTKHGFISDNAEKSDVLTAVLPEGSSPSTYVRKSDSVMDKRKYVKFFS